MSTKYSKWFEETAADPVRRRAAIADLTQQRTIFGCIALFMTATVIASFFTSSPKSYAALTFSAAMIWILTVRIDSRRQVLTLLEKFSRDEKPAA